MRTGGRLAEQANEHEAAEIMRGVESLQEKILVIASKEGSKEEQQKKGRRIYIRWKGGEHA